MVRPAAPVRDDLPVRRFARILSVAMITAGMVILADVGITVAWQEPVSSIYSFFRQGAASSELERLQGDFLDDPEVAGLGGVGDVERRAAELASLFGERLEEGDGIGRIGIPSIDVDYVILEGTDTATLQDGPGRYPTTGLPGRGRTIGIAGHRTTYGAPFNRIDRIEAGDEIELEMPYATFTYEVTGTEIVDPSEVEIVDDVGRERLVLTACHPLYSAAQRYAVFADLEDVSLSSDVS